MLVAGAGPRRGGAGAGAARGRGRAAAARASRGGGGAALRAEAEAPFRVVRKFGFAALAGSAGVGTLTALLKTAAGLFGAQGAGSLGDNAHNLGIDVAALALFGYLFNVEVKAEGKQLARLQREESLAELKVELGARRRLANMGVMRGFARPVVVAGSAAYVRAALAEAEPLKEELQRRGVVVVPLIFRVDRERGLLEAEPLEEGVVQDRWIIAPVRTEEWLGWLSEQAEENGIAVGTDVYLGLRMDGRVRASGVLPPPWAAFVAQLAPTDGAWGSDFMAGFDGEIKM